MFIPSASPAPRGREAKSPKYKNKKVEFRGMKFDSIGERDRYICLLQDQEQGRIINLDRQVKFPLTSNGVIVCHYIADFTYEFPDKTKIVEDYKGVLTDTFQLKAKMFKACYGFDILITKRRAWRSSNVMEGASWKTPKSTTPRKCSK